MTMMGLTEAMSARPQSSVTEIKWNVVTKVNVVAGVLTAKKKKRENRMKKKRVQTMNQSWRGKVQTTPELWRDVGFRDTGRFFTV